MAIDYLKMRKKYWRTKYMNSTFKSLRNYKRRNKVNFMLKSNIFKIDNVVWGWGTTLFWFGFQCNNLIL